MSIKEIFINPTVKQVIFQIRFPNLFYMESKIGELQLKIMDMFPQSSLLYRRPLLFTDLGPDSKPIDFLNKSETESGKKIWQFSSEKNYKLNLLTDSLDIASNHHKTYNSEGADKFRDIIEFVLNNFFEITKISTISRIGLRYIDECPIFQKDNQSLKDYYNSVFPYSRFNVSDTDAMDFIIITKRKQYNLRYAESIKKVDGINTLMLDFDGFAENIKAETALKVTDELHEMINEEFEKSINEPLINFMRTKKE